MRLPESFRGACYDARALRIVIGQWLAALLLVLGVGVQVLEVTGHWDRSLQDATDEAAIVAVTFCIGAGVVVARATRTRRPETSNRSRIVCIHSAKRCPASLRLPTLCASPPLSLRI